MLLHETIMELALKRGFLLPSFEVYNPVAGYFDFGPVGTALKRKLEDHWRAFFVKREANTYEIETTAILPEIVLQASGHVGLFADPIVACSNCKNRFRADHLVRDYIGKNPEWVAKNPDLASLRTEGMSPADLSKLIKQYKFPCPNCAKVALEEVRPFNVMFKTNIGPVEGNTAYARPETAQGIYLDFPRIFRAHGSKLPMGVAQVGRSFRNEIAPRQGLLRLREFTQMELEYFFNPRFPFHPAFKAVEKEKIKLLTREEQEKGSEKTVEVTAKDAVENKLVPLDIVSYFIIRTQQFYESCGIPREKYRFRHMMPEETPHYSGGNFDIEVHTSYGWIETVGIAYRTNYDLTRHSEVSKKDLSVYLEEEKERLVPHVVEPSFGLDRLFWSVLESCYRKGGGAEKRDWEWFDFPARIAPFEVAVLPLMKKDGLAEKARDLAASLREDTLSVLYDESGSIGKRYARMDEIGTPYCLTVDYDTLKDNTVTVRFRNDGKQVRLPTKELASKLREFVRQNKVTA